LHLFCVIDVEDLLWIACHKTVDEQTDEGSHEEDEEDEAEDIGAGSASAWNDYIMFASQEGLPVFVAASLAQFIHLRINYIC
jgi:hypothetical protein